jgi:hypothetical protein
MLLWQVVLIVPRMQSRKHEHSWVSESCRQHELKASWRLLKLHKQQRIKLFSVLRVACC